MNGVAPGPIWTPLNPFGGQPPEKIPEFGKDTPMGRPGQPNEVAPSLPVPRLRGFELHDRPGAPPGRRQHHVELMATTVRFRTPHCGNNSPTGGATPANFAILGSRDTENTTTFSNWHAPCIDNGTDPMVGSEQNAKGVYQCSTFASARETATIFAGAFISALLLVSAATSLPIA